MLTQAFSGAGSPFGPEDRCVWSRREVGGFSPVFSWGGRVFVPSSLISVFHSHHVSICCQTHKEHRFFCDPARKGVLGLILLWLTLHFQLQKQMLCLFENQALGNSLSQCWQNTVFLFLVDLYTCEVCTPVGPKSCLFQWCSCYHVAPNSTSLPTLGERTSGSSGNSAGTGWWHLLSGQEQLDSEQVRSKEKRSSLILSY